MNREIKFRAWDGEQMIYQSLEGHGKINAGWIINNYDTVMQFTGLHDKNGKEIYEGDIVYSNGGITCTVSFLTDLQAYTIGFYLTAPKGFVASLTPSTGNILEIIGNIYENENLLTPA